MSPARPAPVKRFKLIYQIGEISSRPKFPEYKAVYNSNLELDVERVKKLPEMDEVARLVFSRCERDYLFSCASDSKLKSFYKIFTLKEALIKAMGSGFLLPLKELEVPLGNETVIDGGREFYFGEYNEGHFGVTPIPLTLHF